MKVPIIKKEAKIQVELTFNHISSIVNSLFIIAGTWGKEKMEAFKAKLQANDLSSIKDPDEISYIILDNLYRQILKKAEDDNQVDWTEETIGSPINP